MAAAAAAATAAATPSADVSVVAVGAAVRTQTTESVITVSAQQCCRQWRAAAGFGYA